MFKFLICYLRIGAQQGRVESEEGEGIVEELVEFHPSILSDGGLSEEKGKTGVDLVISSRKPWQLLIQNFTTS